MMVCNSGGFVVDYLEGLIELKKFRFFSFFVSIYFFFEIDI